MPSAARRRRQLQALVRQRSSRRQNGLRGLRTQRQNSSSNRTASPPHTTAPASASRANSARVSVQLRIHAVRGMLTAPKKAPETNRTPTSIASSDGFAGSLGRSANAVSSHAAAIAVATINHRCETPGNQSTRALSAARTAIACSTLRMRAWGSRRAGVTGGGRRGVGACGNGAVVGNSPMGKLSLATSRVRCLTNRA